MCSDTRKRDVNVNPLRETQGSIRRQVNKKQAENTTLNKKQDTYDSTPPICVAQLYSTLYTPLRPTRRSSIADIGLEFQHSPTVRHPHRTSIHDLHTQHPTEAIVLHPR